MTIDIGFDGLNLFLLVLTRFIGMINLNPIFTRSNVSRQVRVALSLFLTILVAPTVPLALLPQMDAFTFVFAMVRELFVGYVYGYVFQVFYYLLFYAGDLIDTDIGLSMAKTFDPATNIQVSFSGNFLTLLFGMYFFTTGSHLALIRLFADSFEMIPPGAYTLNTGIFTFALRLFVSVFLLVIRLTAPIIVAEFILQASMGILMRFVPQVTIFVINFQLRIILGLLMLYLFAPYIGNFIDNYITILFDNLLDATALMGGG